MCITLWHWIHWIERDGWLLNTAAIRLPERNIIHHLMGILMWWSHGALLYVASSSGLDAIKYACDATSLLRCGTVHCSPHLLLSDAMCQQTSFNHILIMIHMLIRGFDSNVILGSILMVRSLDAQNSDIVGLTAIAVWPRSCVGSIALGRTAIVESQGLASLQVADISWFSLRATVLPILPESIRWVQGDSIRHHHDTSPIPLSLV